MRPAGTRARPLSLGLSLVGLKLDQAPAAGVRAEKELDPGRGLGGSGQRPEEVAGPGGHPEGQCSPDDLTCAQLRVTPNPWRAVGPESGPQSFPPSPAHREAPPAGSPEPHLMGG